MSDDPKIQIDRINELTTVGRTNWIGLLAYLVFLTITILGVEDVDFFLASEQTEIPIVGVEIPTLAFFWFAPLLGTALYIWLHLLVRKVGPAIDAAPVKIDGQPLETHLKSWILNDMVLMWRGGHERRPLDWLVQIATIGLIWLYGPFVMGLAWYRSWPAHNEFLSAALCACVFACLYVGGTSLWETRRATRGIERLRSVRALCVAVLMPQGLIVAFALTFLKTGLFETLFVANEEDLVYRSASADLSERQFTTLPPGRLDHFRAREDHWASYCDARGISPEVCGPAHDPWIAVDPVISEARLAWCDDRNSVPDCAAHFRRLEADILADFQSYRRAEIAALPRVNLEGADLRNADLLLAHLINADLRGAEMQGADLFRAEMQGADLRWAEMQGADLSGAEMQGADLRWAEMQRADLSGAEMQGADLSWAEMQRADLSGAEMQGAVLSLAEMQRADLSGAEMQGADLSGAEMQGAVLSLAEMQGANLSGAEMQGAFLSLAEMQGANLSGAEMQGADLRWAEMQRADLSGAEMQGADLSGAEFDARTNFAEAVLLFAAVRSVDFRNVDLTQAQVDSLFGDGATLLRTAPHLPDSLTRPAHWPEEVLGFAEFYRQWRAWREAQPGWDPAWE